jgi:hypothetical protein
MGSSGGNRGPSSYFNKNSGSGIGGAALPGIGSGSNNPNMGSFNKNSAIGAQR